MTATIRHASPEDAPALLQLVRDCVAAMRAADIEQWDEIYPDAAVIARDIAAGTLQVMCDDDDIDACITIDRNMDPLWKDLDWNREGDPAAVVHRLMVHPSQQGRGLAKQFMRHAEAVARNMDCRSIRLDSFLQNPAAMALYSRLGYRPTGTAMMRKGPFAGFEKLL
jgi:GNAT superfamily N-acetyltransferase